MIPYRQRFMLVSDFLQEIISLPIFKNADLMNRIATKRYIYRDG
jgi:hypothetical protein